jgi:hypothetical protein
MSITKLLALSSETPFLLFLGTLTTPEPSSGVLVIYAPANLDLVSPL